MYNDIDQALAIWVEQSLNANIDISGEILKEKNIKRKGKGFC